MKRIIALLLCLILCFSFVSCDESSDSKGGKKNVKVGDKLDAPEKIADFDDLDKLTIRTDMKTPQGTRKEVLSYYNGGDTEIYFYEINMVDDNFTMGYYTDVTDGKSVSYNCGWGDYQTVDGIMDGMSDEEWQRMNFAYVGVNPENDKTVIEYVKCEDEVLEGKDCYVYTVKYEEDPEMEEEVSDSTVWVDKETGLWLKSSFTIEGVEVTRTITSIEESVSAIPGTLPVTIEEKDIYNTLQFRLTAKSLDTTNPNYAGVLTLEAENKGAEDIRVYTNSFDANTLTLAQKAFDETVGAGQTVQFECTIPDAAAELAGVEIIKEIAMNLHLETSDGTLIENIDAEKIITSAPATYVQEIDKTGIEILNENGVRAVFKSFEIEADGDKVFKAWVENSYTEPVRITVNFNKINGEEYDDFEKLYMPAHSQGFAGLYLNDDEITELDSIEITCEAFSGALFNSDRVTEETAPITIELN